MNQSSKYALKPLVKEQIVDSLSNTAKTNLSELIVLSETDSTNGFLLNHQANKSKARVCVTESQNAGRGRHGNEWLSAPNQNIMMSLSWGFPNDAKEISSLSLAVAVVVAERLNMNFDLGVKIKWPNDLLVDDNKLAGILIETNTSNENLLNVVVGLGLNVSQPNWSRQDADYDWCDLAGLNVDVDRNQLIADIASDLIMLLRQFEQTGFAPLATRWNEMSSYTEREIIIGEQHGILKGVDDQGALLLLNQHNELIKITDSRLSVRLI